MERQKQIFECFYSAATSFVRSFETLVIGIRIRTQRWTKDTQTRIVNRNGEREEANRDRSDGYTLY